MNSASPPAGIDEASRPSAPRIADLSPQERRYGERLRAYHRYHLSEMGKVEAAIRDVEAERADHATIENEIRKAALARNLKRFGNLCGHECRLLELHHIAEDTRIFPALTGHEAGLDRVIARLAAEHLVIVAALERLERHAAALSQSGDAADFPAVRKAFEALLAVVVSHFRYEEDEIEEAIGRYRPAL